MTPDELTRLREEVARLRDAIAPTEANIETLAEALHIHRDGRADPWPWAKTDDQNRSEMLGLARAVLAAINERAKL